MDPFEYAQGRLRDTTPRFTWSPMREAGWEDELRAELARITGFDRLTARPLDPQIGDWREEDGLRMAPIEWGTMVGMRARGWLLKPASGEATGAGLLAIPGHGAGVDAIVGRSEPDYQDAFARRLAHDGHTVLAVEPISFGGRKSAVEGDAYASCVRDSMLALSLGETMTAWRVFEARCALDALCEGPEVDANRLGVVGISGGGLVAYWLAALDHRVAATVVSGYLNTFRASIFAIRHCPDNFVPGLAETVEMPDMAALIAPRALFAESGTEDDIFPVAAFRAAVRRVKEIYGESDAFGYEEFAGGHRFYGNLALSWLKRRLA